jgi:NCS1 family nucleobase:cation symporter-1
VPDLYRSHGRYRYNKYGTNWRALIAFLISVVPNIPGLAAATNPSLQGKIGGAEKIYDMFYLWGFSSAFFVYCSLSYLWPAKDTLIDASIYEDPDIISGVPYEKGDVTTTEEIAGSGEEKGLPTAEKSHDF